MTSAETGSRSTAVADAAVSLTRELVALDTVNPDLVPGAPGERAAVRLLADRLSSSGFDVVVVEAPGSADRPSLLAVKRGSGEGRSLVLNGHLDTVGTGGMADPFTPRLEGDEQTGQLHGRGTCDMKAGVAAMVACAERVAVEGTDGDLLVALVADEESGSVGTEAVLAELARRGLRPDACIVGEPTWLDVAVAHRGFAVLDVEIRGRAAHSSRPADGVNAVTHLGRFLSAVERADRDLQQRPAHPLAGRGSLMATVVSGGEAPFTLAATASAVVERRTVPGEQSDVARDEVESLLSDLRADDPAIDTRCTVRLAREAWQARDDDTATLALLELIEAGLLATGWRPPTPVGEPYWMESALWEGAGIPSLVWGPAGGGLHGDVEWVDLSQLRTYAVALQHVVERFCGVPR